LPRVTPSLAVFGAALGLEIFGKHGNGA